VIAECGREGRGVLFPSFVGEAIRTYDLTEMVLAVLSSVGTCLTTNHCEGSTILSEEVALLQKKKSLVTLRPSYNS
jgi:hypothetical protein